MLCGWVTAALLAASAPVVAQPSTTMRVLLLPVGSPKPALMGLADVTTTLLLGALRTRPALDVTAPSEVAMLQGLAVVQDRAGATPTPSALRAAVDLRVSELVTAELDDSAGMRLVLRRINVSDATVVQSVERSLGDNPEAALARAVGLAVEDLYPLAEFGGAPPRPTRPYWLGLGVVGSLAAAGLCAGGVVMAVALAAVFTARVDRIGSDAFPYPVAALLSAGVAVGVLVGMVGLGALGSGLVAALVGG